MARACEQKKEDAHYVLIATLTDEEARSLVGHPLEMKIINLAPLKIKAGDPKKLDTAHETVLKSIYTALGKEKPFLSLSRRKDKSIEGFKVGFNGAQLIELAIELRFKDIYAASNDDQHSEIIKQLSNLQKFHEWIMREERKGHAITPALVREASEPRGEIYETL